MKFKINEKLAEETGIHVGDGSMNIYNGIYAYTLACHHIDDKEYMTNYVIPLYNELYNIFPKLKPWSKGTIGFRIHNKEIVDFKNKILGLPLGKKMDITIPQQILDDVNLQKAFLRGFVSTDGSINTFLSNKTKIYPRIEMCNTSKTLMMQINTILIDLGFKTSIWTINKNKKNWEEGLRLTINGFKMLRKWDEEIGFPNKKHQEKLKLLAIKE